MKQSSESWAMGSEDEQLGLMSWCRELGRQYKCVIVISIISIKAICRTISVQIQVNRSLVAVSE